MCEKLCGVGQVGLCNANEGREPRVVGGHEVAVDEAHARLRVCGGHDDKHLVGVCNDDALDPIRVVGAASQQGFAVGHANDAREAAFVTGTVADELDAVTRDDRGVAQLACAGGDNGA